MWRTRRARTRTLSAHHPLIIVEHDDRSAHAYGYTTSDFHALLTDLGYSILDIDGHGPLERGPADAGFPGLRSTGLELDRAASLRLRGHDASVESVTMQIGAPRDANGIGAPRSASNVRATSRPGRSSSVACGMPRPCHEQNAAQGCGRPERGDSIGPITPVSG